MRELHGVIHSDRVYSQKELKRLLLFFDKLSLVSSRPVIHAVQAPFTADVAFLTSRGIIQRPIAKYLPTEVSAYTLSPSIRHIVLEDILVRDFVRELPTDNEDVVPIYQISPPLRESDPKTAAIRSALSVGFSAMPTPDESSALQDILDFKAELHDKQWGFRRFLKNLATKQQSEGEIRDEIEWMLNEYARAMKIHHIKASQSFVDVFVISPLEIIENLIKFNWSKIAKGALAFQKRNVELIAPIHGGSPGEARYCFWRRDASEGSKSGSIRHHSVTRINA